MTERAVSSALLERFVASLNEHDLDGLLSCFHDDYESDQPAHPERWFQGKERLSENWAWVFDSFEDFSAQLVDHALSSNTLWTEWLWTGTHPSGRSFEVRGVMILVVERDLFRCGRLYLEPLE